MNKIDKALENVFEITQTSGCKYCKLTCYVNINNKILIKVNEDFYDLHNDFGFDDESEFNEASIEITKEMAIELINELGGLINQINTN
jgi:hypothetical protein